MPDVQQRETVSFICTIVQGIAAAFYVAKEVYAGRGRAEGRVNTVTINRPKMLLALILGMVATGGYGLWLVYHPPATSGVNLSSSVVKQADTPSVKAGTLPIKPKLVHRPTSTPLLPASGRDNQRPKQDGVVNQQATQGGTSNQQTTIAGDLKQGGNGDCQQNVVGGSNNTNNCAPVDRKLSDKQISDLKASFCALPYYNRTQFDTSYFAAYPDAADYLNQIDALLRGCGTGSAGENEMIGPHGKGIIVQYAPDDARGFHFASALNKAFNDTGISSVLVPNPGQQGVILYVGGPK